MGAFAILPDSALAGCAVTGEWRMIDGSRPELPTQEHHEYGR
jgi:hypothetical protein